MPDDKKEYDYIDLEADNIYKKITELEQRIDNIEKVLREFLKQGKYRITIDRNYFDIWIERLSGEIQPKGKSKPQPEVELSLSTSISNNRSKDENMSSNSGDSKPDEPENVWYDNHDTPHKIRTPEDIKTYKDDEYFEVKQKPKEKEPTEVNTPREKEKWEQRRKA